MSGARRGREGAGARTLVELLLHLVDAVLGAREAEDALGADAVENDEVHTRADEARDLEVCGP